MISTSRIVLNPIQSPPFYIGEIRPLLNNWQWRNSLRSTFPVFDFIRNQPTSGAFNYEIKTKSAFRSYSFDGYTSLKVRSEIVYETPFEEWLTVNSPLFPVSNYTELNSTQWRELNLTIQPSLLIPVGNHRATIKFRIEGTLNNIVTVLSTFDFPVVLNVFEEGRFYSPMNFTFYKNENAVQNQALSVGGNNWTLNVPRGVKLLSSVNNISNLPAGGYQSGGSGLTNFQLNLESYIDEMMGENLEMTFPLSLVYNTNSYVIPVRVIQTGDVFPNNIRFIIASGVVDYDFRTINVNKPGDFTLQFSPWLDCTVLDLSSGRVIQVFLADTSVFGSGNFDGFVRLIFQDETIEVAVNVLSTTAIDIGVAPDEVIFTKTMEDFVFTSNNENNYIEMQLTIPNVVNQNYLFKTPFISGVVNQNIGMTLDREIRFVSESLYATFNMNYFSINIKEKIGEQILLEYNKIGIPVMKGAKPVVISNQAILQHCSTSRFTKNGFALINVLSATGMYQYEVLKNSEVIFSSAINFGYIVTLPFVWEDYDLNDGDTIDFVLKVNGERIKKTFVFFPETTQSYTIMYEDSFGLKSTIEFTGSNDLIELVIDNKVETFNKKTFFHTRNFKVSESLTIKLNTGFVLKNQIVELRELLNSPRAWLYVNNEKKLDLVIKSEKLQLKSSEEFLYSYDVEFLINENQYAQDYNF